MGAAASNDEGPRREAGPFRRLERETGFEPATLGLRMDFTDSPLADRASQALVTTGDGEGGGVQPSQPNQMLPRGFVTPLLPGNVTVSVEPGRMLTVREAARLLRVSTATVYNLCTRGKLGHVRVLNIIRVPAGAITTLANTNMP
ncbi:MAG: helix-turn-helix domain-containing protein [Anaeromyxobacteraceae bacterium]|nr:helix-turn-helix domain-containing protein [Anaeromyxobacteraceae bacterium]